MGGNETVDIHLHLTITTIAAIVNLMQLPDALEKITYVAALAGETISCHVDSEH